MGLGAFATKDIRKGDFLGFYVGELLTREEADQRHTFVNGFTQSSYLFTCKGKLENIDAVFFGNQTRFANHLPDEFANASTKMSEDKLEGFVVFYATEPIPKGSEIFIDYGKSYNFSWIKQ